MKNSFIKLCRALNNTGELTFTNVNNLLELTIENPQLVYAECHEVTDKMREDKRLDIISDGAIFIVTTKVNSLRYPGLKWEIVTEDALIAYKDAFVNL